MEHARALCNLAEGNKLINIYKEYKVVSVDAMKESKRTDVCFHSFLTFVLDWSGRLHTVRFGRDKSL